MKNITLPRIGQACLGAVAVIMLLSAGSCDDKSEAEKASETEIAETGDQMKILTDAQPAIRVPYSQVRQTLIIAEYLAASGAATHTFAFIPGGTSTAPYFECDSVGFPVPGTFNLTNPLVEDPNNSADHGIVVAQAEGTLGVYTGDTSGTYVVCLTGDGDPYVKWIEGIVDGGNPVGSYWDDELKRVVVPSDVDVVDTPVAITQQG